MNTVVLYHCTGFRPCRGQPPGQTVVLVRFLHYFRCLPLPWSTVHHLKRFHTFLPTRTRFDRVTDDQRVPVWDGLSLERRASLGTGRVQFKNSFFFFPILSLHAGMTLYSTITILSSIKGLIQSTLTSQCPRYAPVLQVLLSYRLLNKTRRKNT